MSACNWPVAFPENCDCTALSSLSEAEQEAVKSMAVDLLWAWTGRQYGACETTVRPCREECAPGPSTFWGPRGGAPSGRSGGWLPVLIGGEWFNVRCGWCSGGCTCSAADARALTLPGVVAEITSIVIDGETLPKSAYKLEGSTVIRQDGQSWPPCNDMVGDPTQPGSGAWEITYLRGQAVPESGGLVAGVLACELAKALCQDDTCQLPQRVQSITRQGVSIGAVLDTFDDLKEGRTGIWIVDSWVAQANAPRGSRPVVASPDVRPGRRGGTMRGLGFGGTR